MSKSKVEPISQEELEQYELPADYAHDVVCNGTPGKTAEGVMTTYINKMHVVKPSGRLACTCKLDPANVYVYPNVQAPPDWRGMYCEESSLYMRVIVAQLKEGK